MVLCWLCSGGCVKYTLIKAAKSYINKKLLQVNKLLLTYLRGNNTETSFDEKYCTSKTIQDD